MSPINSLYCTFIGLYTLALGQDHIHVIYMYKCTCTYINGCTVHVHKHYISCVCCVFLCRYNLDTTYNVSPISEFSICRYACVVRVSCIYTCISYLMYLAASWMIAIDILIFFPRKIRMRIITNTNTVPMIPT